MSSDIASGDLSVVIDILIATNNKFEIFLAQRIIKIKLIEAATFLHIKQIVCFVSFIYKLSGLNCYGIALRQRSNLTYFS